LEAREYGLLVFTSFERARRWAREWWDGQHRIFECTVGELMPLPPCCSPFRVGYGGKLTPTRSPWPEGTMMVSSVTLKREREVW